MNPTIDEARRSADIILRVAATLAIGFLLTACASRTYSPEPIDSVGLVERAITQEAEGVRVRAAVPSAEEAQALFGIPIYDRGIQPIWLEITNDQSERVRFAPVGTDPEYFPAHEVAYMHKGRYAKQGYADFERSLAEGAMDRWIWPGETRSGFVFTHSSPGTKAFNVDVFTATDSPASFSFFIDVPGFEPDHSSVDFQSIYRDDEIRSVDLAGLRIALSEFSCCTTGPVGDEAGLPMNLALVGSGEDVLKALLRAGWSERPRAEKSEMLERVPHWNHRPADAVFRTLRSGKRERNELRLWLTPLRSEGEAVWVAQITHYIGRPTELGRALFDPRLDPNLDEATSFMIQRMWYAQTLSRFAWQDTGVATTLESHATDFRGVSYFSSGVRAVLWLSADPVSQMDTTDVQWDPPPFRRRP